MTWCVNLYWGGKIIPGAVISYDPPFAKGFIMLDEPISYDGLLEKICERMGISIYENKIQIIWKRTICFGSGVTFMGVLLDELCMQLMFSESMVIGGVIELYVEHSAITQHHSHHVISYDVGTSTRAQEPYFAATQDYDVGTSTRAQEPYFAATQDYDVGTSTRAQDFDVAATQDFEAGGVHLGENDNCDVVEDILGPDKADFLDPQSPYYSEDSDPVSTDSDGDPSDDEQFVASRPSIPLGETTVGDTVIGETSIGGRTDGGRVVPQFPQRGINYFRTLPGPYDSFDPKTFEPDDPSVHYWSEKDPSNVGLHTRFRTKLELKAAVTHWHLEKIRQYTVVESKGKRWHAVCKWPQGNPKDTSLPKCLWECRATLRKHDDHWQIRVFSTAHTCMGDRNYNGHANLSSGMIALSVRHQIENDPCYKVKAIVADIENRFHVKVSYKKAWYARRTAIELVYGGWEWSFKVLPAYLTEMQRQNPGTIVEWLHDDILSNGMNKVFKYVFWAFGPAVEAFQLCKPVLTVDGTHLRGRCRGKILIAVGFDANKKCLPVAYAIVDEETKESWSWFMERIRLHVAKNEICVISDRHLGIIYAMNSPIWKEEPLGHHRFCLVHVRKNVTQVHKGIMVKRLVWKIGIATKKRKFKKRCRLLRDIDNEALQYLDAIELEKWTLAYDKHKRWGEMSTNIVESYNNVLRGARQLPIKACIDMIFWRTIEWFNERSIASTQCATPLTPWAHEKVRKHDVKGQLHNVRASNTIAGIYLVRTKRRLGGKGGNKWKVKYLESKCKCQKWQMWRLPCSHAAAVARFRNDNMLSLVNPVYHTSVWAHQYSAVFNPLRHQDYWVVPEWNLQCSRAQLMPKSRGRYRTTRIRNQMDVREADQPRAQRRCKHCRQPGHDRRNCPNALSRMDTQLVDDAADAFMPPPPSRSALRGRHSVSHTDDAEANRFIHPSPPGSALRGRHSVSHFGSTGEDIGFSDVPHSQPRSSMRDNVIVENTPPSRLPTTNIGKSIRSFFTRKRRDN